MFGEDVAIPGEVVARLWAHTGGWTTFQARRLCRRLFDLGLLAGYRRNPDRLVLHDVIRTYLRDTTRSNAPSGTRRWSMPTGTCCPGGGLGRSARRAGISVVVVGNALVGAGRRDELEALLADPRWLVHKLERVGPAGLESDLRLSELPTSRALATVVRQNAHLLGPLDPPGSLAATFASRLPDHTGLDELREQILATINGPHLRSLAPIPDLPHDALLRVLTGHTGAVAALAVAPDGSWLASAGGDGDETVRIWDPHTGQARHTLTGHTSAVAALAVAPDGSWLASAGGYDGDDGADLGPAHRADPPHPHRPHQRGVGAGGRPGRHLAGLRRRATRTVRIWDPHTGQTRHTLTGHTGPVRALAVAPDGSWLASAGCDDATVRIWDPHTGQARHTLTGHTGPVQALAVAPDGTWLASASADATVRIWSIGGRSLCRVLPHRSRGPDCRHRRTVGCGRG